MEIITGTVLSVEAHPKHIRFGISRCKFENHPTCYDAFEVRFEGSLPADSWAERYRAWGWEGACYFAACLTPDPAFGETGAKFVNDLHVYVGFEDDPQIVGIGDFVRLTLGGGPCRLLESLERGQHDG